MMKRKFSWAILLWNATSPLNVHFQCLIQIKSAYLNSTKYFNKLAGQVVF